MKLLHIGLPKCGSTFLQKDILPEVANKLNIKYQHHYWAILNKERKKLYQLKNSKKLNYHLPNKFIISNQSMFSRGWEFFNIHESFKHIKNNFSKDTIILIVIRNPYEFFNSIYCQTIHDMNIVRPEKFFYHDKKSVNIRIKNKYNLYNFDYVKLISLYKSYFKKVVVVKYENLQKLEFLKEIFNLDGEYLKYLKKNNYKIYNKSISRFAINFILFLNNFFNVEKYDKFIRNNIKPSNKIFGKIKNKILRQFLLRPLFQKKIDKILPYRKYRIKKSYIPININNEISKYKKLKF